MTEPYRYLDEDQFCLSARLLPDLNNGGNTDILSITIEGSDEPQSVHVPAADAPAVASGIVAAAGLAAEPPPPAVSVGQLARILHETAVATTLGDDGPDWDQLTGQAIDRYRTMAGLVIERLPLAAPPPAAYQADLRDRVAAAIWARTPEAEPSRNGLVMGNPHGIADAVLAALLGPIPADIDTASWTAIRAIQLMNEAGEQTEAYRLALSQALGLGTGAPWDAITERASELRRLADEAQQPETQAPEPPVVCEGFVWIGQSFATCDRCGQPAWDHAGRDAPVEGAVLFDTRRTVIPWEPGEADRIRAKWAPNGSRSDGEQPS
ncbi:hypothetical protein ACWERY_16070 [Streptomyces sp. NPDC004082]